MNNTKRLVFVIPYLGDLPGYAHLFFKSVERNPCIEVLLFVDRTPAITPPSNVHIKHTDKLSLLELIERKTGLQVTEMTGHKLCDFKPLYGLLFSDQLKGYQWWGHCDIDLMFGDLGPWLDQRLGFEYDVVTASPNSTIGHFTIYRNDKLVNSAMSAMAQHDNYRPLFMDPETRHLDEGGAYKYILSCTNLKMLTTPPLHEAITHGPVPLGITFRPDGKIADLDPPETGVAYWKDGRTWYQSTRRKPVEVLYIHFMGNKAWYHWLFYRPVSSSKKCDIFSPIGYGLISDARGVASIQYKAVRALQIIFYAAKVRTGKALRQLVDPSTFRRIRRLVTPSGRYR